MAIVERRAGGFQLALEQHLQGLAGVLQAGAGLIFREQTLMDSFFADVVDLVGEAGKAGVDARGLEVVVDFVEQVAEGCGVAVAGSDEVAEAVGEFLLDGFLEDRAAHDSAGGEEREEVAAGGFVEIAVGILRGGLGYDALAEVCGAGYCRLDEVKELGGEGGADEVVLAGIEGSLDGFPGWGEAIVGLLQAGEGGEPLAGVLDESLLHFKGELIPFVREC